MSATPKQRLQRLNQCGYALIGAGTFMLLSWINPVEVPQSGAVLVFLIVALGSYHRLRQRSR